MHLSELSMSGHGDSWARTSSAALLSDDVAALPDYDDSWSRRHYWQAVLLLSAGLSLLLGALVFIVLLVAALALRPGRCSGCCTPGTAGAAAATLSALALVAMLVCTKAVDAYE